MKSIYEELFYIDESSPSGLRAKVDISKTILKDSPVGKIEKTSRPYKKWHVRIPRPFCTKHNLPKSKKIASRIIAAIIHGDSAIEGKHVDHIDGNALNNSVSNLRIVNHEVNVRNRKLSVKNYTGCNGVTLRIHMGKYLSYVAQAYALDGKHMSKKFSTKKYGLLEAFALAVEWREQKIKELNEQGAGYTERHGK